MPHIYSRIGTSGVFLGVLIAERVEAEVYPPAFDQELRSLLKERGQELAPEEEAIRKNVRDMLRNGRYKPTGRGKPASEYLVRCAREAEDQEVPHDAFPRINALVDACNFISLRYLLPISLWDHDKAGTDHIVFRLGRENESYVFNESGQPIDVEDLVVGCRSSGPDDDGEPIVNPVKDSMATKTSPETMRVGGVIYSPKRAMDSDRLRSACEDFAALLAGCGSDASARYGIISPGGDVEI